MPIETDIQQAIAEANQILVITHIGPDGDAIGSLTAVGQMLQQWGKSFTLACDSPIPKRFEYLPMSERIKTAPAMDTVYDLVIAVDCGDALRMGQAHALLPQPHPFLINIDHHITNTQFGDINLINAKATSTTEILYGLFIKLGLKITTDTAMCLLTGLVTDTMGFRTVGVTAKTLQIASNLMEAGADLSLVTMQALKLKPMSTLRLWQTGLNKMRLEDGLIWVSISDEERKAIGYTSSSSAGLVNIMSDVYQAAISAVLMEMGDGYVQVGFRCHPPYSVAELAMNLGGGGHSLASGCRLEGPLSAAESLVVKMGKETIQQQQMYLNNGH